MNSFGFGNESRVNNLSEHCEWTRLDWVNFDENLLTYLGCSLVFRLDYLVRLGVKSDTCQWLEINLIQKYADFSYSEVNLDYIEKYLKVFEFAGLFELLKLMKDL